MLIALSLIELLVAQHSDIGAFVSIERIQR